MKKKLPIKFTAIKLLLVGGLVCEVLAYLIRQGTLQWDPALVNRLTLAGALLALIYLVWTGLAAKYEVYSKRYEQAMKDLDEMEREAAEDAAEE